MTQTREVFVIHLSPETETLARQLADARGLSLDEAVALAIKQTARTSGIAHSRRRQTVPEMLAVGAEIAAMPILDTRSPRQIMDDINAE